MKGRVGINGGRRSGPPSDLLVCFPTRAHLSLMPKPVCSPSRPTDHTKRHHQSRPLFRTTNNNKLTRNQIGSEIGSEPTSPKVTCAGQIKNRTGRARSDNISKKWLESVGIKKDVVMHFLGALRSFRFNMHCFGSFPGGPVVVDSSSDEEDEVIVSGGSQSSNVFSKWLMALEESHGDEVSVEEMPPENALLLMRCRSAPAKRGGEEVAKKVVEEEEDYSERLMLMSYAPDFFKVLSTDIAKETWVDPLARSRSWRA